MAVKKKKKAKVAKRGVAKRTKKKVLPKRKVRAAKTKRTTRKTPVKKRAVKKEELELPGLQQIGKVTHYFPHVKAAVVTITKGTVSVGDQIYIKGHTTNFKETVTSMQINRIPIQQAKQGDEIGLLVKSRARINDKVYKI